jgi:hypothetical protein
MKYLITESQLDRAVFRYLDNQDFIVTGNDTSLFFVNSENEKYAQIRYDEDDDWCYIDYDLIGEISSFFSLRRSDSKEAIGRWVENTLQMKVTNTSQGLGHGNEWLRIPSN